MYEYHLYKDNLYIIFQMIQQDWMDSLTHTFQPSSWYEYYRSAGHQVYSDIGSVKFTNPQSTTDKK